MAAVVLLAGFLLGVFGVAVLLGGDVAASRPMRSRSRRYAQVCLVGGAVLVVAGAVGLVQSL